MEASEVLAKAWAAVVDANLPPEIQETAFKAAIAMIDAAPRQMEIRSSTDVTKSELPAETDASEPSTSSLSAEQRFETLANESGVDRSALEEVFFFDPDGTPHINLPGRKLGNSMTAKVQAIVTGLAGVNYFVSDHTTLPLETIRSESQSKAAYDQSNFSRHIADAPGVTVSGSGSARVFRVKQNDIDAAFKAMVNAVRGTTN
ncbi:hypothetical protein [Lacisediminihabitans sp.]|jgi:hypothetical protein|uniref:hypothetical protein n=1 Tax=Lacisediminihabitans sp. TaxID=2787631 RepID=UPI002F94D3EA